MSDFKARKQARIQDAKDGVKFRFDVVAKHYTIRDEVVGSFKSHQDAKEFTRHIGPFVGDCRALLVFMERHKNNFIPSISFEIVREKVEV